MPELLPGVDVRQVHLHDGQPAVHCRVPQGEAVVRQGPGVDDEARGVVGGGLQVVYDTALVVGLKELDFYPQLVRLVRTSPSISSSVFTP